MEGGKNMKKRYVLILAFSLILVLVIAIGLNSDIFKNIGGNQVSTGDGTTVELKINKLDEMMVGSLDADIKTVEILSDKGLIEYEESSDALGKYRLLTRCICCPTKVSIVKKPLSLSITPTFSVVFPKMSPRPSSPSASA